MAAHAITPETFTRAVEAAGHKTSQWYSDFLNHFGTVPDERGLTDMFLLYTSTGLSQAHGHIAVTPISQVLEGKTGYDYAWEFSYVDKTTGKVSFTRKFTAYLQAKTLKPNGHDFSANFTYTGTSKKMQMRLLADTVEKARKAKKDPNEKVVGGYILYGPKYTRFINVADVITMNGKNVGQSDKVDQVMSAGIAHSSGFLLTNMLNENGELH